jgi:hypothetical protein
VLHVVDTLQRAREKLQKPPVDTVLGQVGDVGVASGVDDELLRELQRVAVGDEPGVDLRGFDPAAPLGHPKRGMVLTAEPRPHVLHVVSDCLHRPVHHRQYVPAPGRLALLGLAVADEDVPGLVELR